MKPETLYVCDVRGNFLVASSDVVIASAKRQPHGKVRRGTALTSPGVVRDFLSVTLGDRGCEYFCLLLLDSRHRVLRFVKLFRGTSMAPSVHPREVVKVAIEARTAAVVLVHNYPSQVAEPSTADELISRRLRDALALIEIRVLDHLIVAGSEVVSFSERGLI